jgi:EmrB/QacA subfamily drug resistance transporter
MGIGAAMVQPQTLSIITNVFAPRDRGKAIGIWAAFSGIAIALGPITGGFLLENFWWGSIFLVNIPVVIIGSVAAMMLVPESRDPNPGRLDPTGVLLSIAGITALVYGIIKGGETSDWFAPETSGFIALGLALIAVFVLMERRSSHPSLDVTLFKRPEFTAATVALSVVFFAMMGLVFAGAYYLQAVRGYSPLKAGALIVPVSLGIMITAPLSSKFAARFGARNVIVTGMLLAGLSMGGYYLFEGDTSLWVFEAVLLVMGLGMGNVMAPATESVMSAVPREKAGAGSAVNTTVRMMAGALGVAILGSVLSTRYRSALGDDVDALPKGERHEAGESIGATFQAIGSVAERVQHGQLPPSAAAGLGDLAESAKDAFLTGMHSVALCSWAIAWLGALVAAIWLPAKKKDPLTSGALESPTDTDESVKEPATL